MTTRTEDVEAAIGALSFEVACPHNTSESVRVTKLAVSTLLASHAALTAFVANVAEPHHSSDHYSLATAFERFQTRARALLSGKASA